MRRINIVALLFLLVPISFAQNCPPGYSTQDNKVCYRVYNDLSSKADASLKCFADGGYLASVPNGFANSYVSSLAKNAGAFVWLGIQCSNGDRSTCVNDDYSPFGPYSNFAPGNPSTFGNCVYLSQKSPTNLQWLSFDCSASFAYVCEYRLAPQVPQCPIGYSLNGKSCYKVNSVGQNAVNAELDCNRDCGHLVSINSDIENNFVTSLTNVNAVGSGVIRIGLKVQPSIFYHYWSDGLAYNYSRIEYDAVEVGQCYVLALQKEIVSKGSWANDNCQALLPYVCKTAPGTCNANPTLSPPTCNATQYYSDRGSVYSPGYPSGYSATSCVNYLFTQQGSYVKVSVDELLLDNYSQLQLFNSISDISPFDVITSSTSLNSTFQSSTNAMVVIFTSSISYNGRWKLNFSTGYAGPDPITVPPPVTVPARVTVPVTPKHTTPKPTATCPTDYSYFKGMCYLYYQRKNVNTTPNQARINCRKIAGGNLATVNSLEVNQFIETLETKNNQYTAFGLRCTQIKSNGDTASCMWDDGTPFSYDAFTQNHPSSLYNGCCNYNQGNWNNCYNCDGSFNAYVCQAPPQ